jgi:DNA mismatch repair protein MutH
MAIATATQSLACDRRPPREPCSPAQRRLPVSFMLFSATIGGGCTVEKPDHRHRRLLRARREGPRRSSAAEERDEAAPFIRSPRRRGEQLCRLDFEELWMLIDDGRTATSLLFRR